MMLNLFTVLLNNNDVRQITAELVESEISQQNINLPRPYFNLLHILLVPSSRYFLRFFQIVVLFRTFLSGKFSVNS